MNTMTLSAYVYGCTVSATPVPQPPEPTVSDFLPPVIDHAVDQIVSDQIAANNQMLYDYTRRNIDVIDGNQF